MERLRQNAQAFSQISSNLSVCKVIDLYLIQMLAGRKRLHKQKIDLKKIVDHMHNVYSMQLIVWLGYMLLSFRNGIPILTSYFLHTATG